MAEIVWSATPLIDLASPGSTPGTDPDIDNAFNAAAYAKIWVTSDVTAGTDPSLTVEVWLWNGARFVRTGDVYDLEPGVANLLDLLGGGRIALEVTANGGPSDWSITLGTQR